MMRLKERGRLSEAINRDPNRTNRQVSDLQEFLQKLIKNNHKNYENLNSITKEAMTTTGGIDECWKWHWFVLTLSLNCFQNCSTKL